MKYLCLVMMLALGLAATASAEQETLWSRTYGGPGADGSKSLIRTYDGGFALVGYTFSQGAGEADVYLVKTDAAGNFAWDRAYGGPGRDYGYDLCQCPDGGYLLVGQTSSFGAGLDDLYLIKTDADGDLIWQTTFGGAQIDAGHAICAGPDDHYVLCGSTESQGAGLSDVWVIKVNADGQEVWSQTFGGTESDRGTDILAATAGGYVALGASGSYSANRDVHVIRIGEDGSETWSRNLGGASDCDWGRSVCETSDGGFVVAGHGDIHSNDLTDVILLKLDAQGRDLWMQRFGESTFYDYGRGVCTTLDGGFLICGAVTIAETGKHEAYVIKTDSAGRLSWSYQIGAAGSDWTSAVVETGPGSYVLAGHTDSYGAGRFDAWLVGLHDPLPQGAEPAEDPGSAIMLASSNPVSAGATIRFALTKASEVELVIVDTTGREVSTLVDGPREKGMHTIDWHPDAQASGVYYAVLRVNGSARSRRLVVLN